jgi:hypothetical protein
VGKPKAFPKDCGKPAGVSIILAFPQKRDCGFVEKFID